MYYVYILKSENFSKQTYIGFTKDLRKRLKAHNDGGNPHTSKFRPWQLIFYSAFENKDRALEFERYLKTHSGKAFATKHLI